MASKSVPLAKIWSTTLASGVLAASCLVAVPASAATVAAPAVAAVPAASVSSLPVTRNWAMPLKADSYNYSSPKGPRCVPVQGGTTEHLGQDLAAADGTAIYAVGDGTVTRVANPVNGASGQIVVEHNVGGRRVFSGYYHMWTATKYVKVGQKVKAGQRIALVGSSGPSTGAHLHLDIWYDAWYSTGTAIDPVPFLKSRGVDLKGGARVVYNLTTPSTCTYYAATTLNLRSSASLSAPVKVVLPHGTRVTSWPGAYSNQFVQVKATVKGVSYSGWVWHPYVTPSDPTTKPVTLTTANPTHKATTNLNMRDLASASGQRLLIIATGGKVKVTGTSGTWSKVTYGTRAGWVSTAYLSKLASSGSSSGSVDPTGSNVDKLPATSEKKASGAALATSKQTMRASASTSAKAVRTVPSGAIVSLKATSGSWYKIAYGGKTGYIKQAGTAKVKGASGLGMMKSKQTLRSYASTSAAAVRTASAGTAITFRATAGDWYQISQRGQVGWVRKSTVTKGTKATTTAGVHLRTGASTSKKSLTVLKRSSVVYIVGTSGKWRKVVAGSRVGWVHGGYLK
jgi:SH3-like domain-containing protein